MIKRRLAWAVLNGVVMTSGALGLFYGVTWALNIFLFLTWTTVILSFLCAANKESRLETRAKGRPVPRWISVGCDVVIVLALAGVGRFVLAAGMLMQICFESYVMEGKD